MAIVNATITQVGEETTEIPDRLTNPRYVLEWEFGTNQTIYILSHWDIIPLLPGGAVYLQKCQIGGEYMPAINRNVGLTSGKATISAPTYEVVDVDGELTAEIASKSANGVGTLNTIIRDWAFEAGDTDWYNGVPRHTAFVKNHSKPYNTVVIETADINRELERKVFKPFVWRLRSTINSTQTSIPITLPVADIADNQVMFEHSDQYRDAPGDTVGYGLIEQTGEVFRYTGLINQDGVSTFTGVTRGVLGTIAKSVTISLGTAEENAPTIKEWIVLDEPATSIPYALISGSTRDTGRALPSHWCIGSDAKWLHTPSFARNASPFRLFFQGLEEEKVKEFLEKEVLPTTFSALNVRGDGKLELISKQLPTDPDAGQIVLDASNCINDNLTLVHDKSEIAPTIKINYDYNPHAKEYLSPVIYHNEDSATFNNADAVKEFNFRGVQAGLHTNAQMKVVATSLGDDHYYEQLELNVESFINGIPLGTLVTVDFDQVRDDATGVANTQPLKRTMLVVACSEDRATQTTRYQLRGSLYRETQRLAGAAQHNIPLADYKRGRINLATLPGISINAGLASGSVTFDMGKEYYYVDDAEAGTGIELGAGLTVNVSGRGNRLLIAVYGPLIISTTIDLTGKSNHEGGLGGTQNTDPGLGDSGFVLNSRATQHLDVTVNYRSFLSSDVTVYAQDGIKADAPPQARALAQRGRYASAPILPLDINDGVLRGIPSDLGGTAGPGGRVSKVYDPDRKPAYAGDPSSPSPTTTYINGSSGGIPGGGLVIISWAGGVTASGKIILSGEDAQPAQNEIIGVVQVNGAQGGNGGPGAFYWIVDGDHIPPVLTSSMITAAYGTQNPVGSVLSSTEIARDTGIYRGRGNVQSGGNYFQSVSRIIYTPLPQTLSPNENLFSSLAIYRQEDGQINLIITDSVITASTVPSNGLPGDIAVWQQDLDGNSARPPAWIMGNDYQWTQLDWTTAPSDYETLIAVNRQSGGTTSIISATRPIGYAPGTHWLNSSNETEWILGATAEDDKPFRERGAPVGDELLQNGNFAQGNSGWILTRDATLEPRNIYQQILDEIAQAFISHGVLEGEYVDPATIVPASDVVLPLVSMTAVATSDTEITITWTQQADISGIAAVELYLGNVQTVSSTLSYDATSPFVWNQAVASTTYTINAINRGANGEESTAISKQVTTQAAGGGGQLGITFTDTGGTLDTLGRRVYGIAYQNNESVIIQSGRQATLTLNDGSQFIASIAADNVGGSFEFFVPTSYDSNLNKSATVYTNNGDDTTKAQAEFTYQL